MWVAGAAVKNGTSSQESKQKRFVRTRAVLLVVRIRYTLQVGGGTAEAVGFAVCECSHGSQEVDIVDADFFDESLLVIAFRSQEDGMSLR